MWWHLAWLWLPPSIHDHRCCCCCRRHCRCVDVDAVHCLSPCCTHLVSNTTWRPPSHPDLYLHPKFLFRLFFFNLFLPLVFFFFSILVSDSSRQSWESTMPSPVSKSFFRERVKGSLQTIIHGIGERCRPNLIKPAKQLLPRLVLSIFSSSEFISQRFKFTFAGLEPFLHFYYPFFFITFLMTLHFYRRGSLHAICIIFSCYMCLDMCLRTLLDIYLNTCLKMKVYM